MSTIDQFSQRSILSACPGATVASVRPRRDRRSADGQNNRWVQGLLAVSTVAMLYLCASSESPLYSAVGGALTMLGVNMLVPACRPRSPIISPYNWAWGIFFLELVIVPANIMLAGVRRATLPSLPSASSIEWVYILTILGYLSFSLAYWNTMRGVRRRAHGRSAMWTMNKGAALLYISFGALGLALAFTRISIVDYYSSPASIRDKSLQTSATLADALSELMRPFLVFGAVALWSRIANAGAKSRYTVYLGAICCACVIVLVYSTFSYNRGGIAVSLVCMTAAFSRHVRSVPFWVLSCVGGAFLFAMLFLGQYRESNLNMNAVLNDKGVATSLVSKADLSDLFQNYTSAPQFSAYLLERTGNESGWATEWYGGQPLIGTVMYPVPILGKGFREGSTLALYNREIYGNSVTLDQPVPFLGEIFMNFNIVGVLLGFCALGLVLGRIQQGFEATSSGLGTFCFQFMTIWICYSLHTSLGVVSQAFTYFCFPIYGLIATDWLRKRRLRRTPLRRVARAWDGISDRAHAQ